MLAVQRFHGVNPRLFWGRLINPAQLPLAEIQTKIERYQNEPVERVFRKQLILSRLPFFVRRPIWWGILNLSARQRAHRIGTFSQSSLAGQGAVNRDHPTILSSSLTYGPLDDHDHSLVTLLYDHRLLDGVTAAAALQQLDDCLNGSVADELASLARRAA
jgi:hypothetical protein